MLVALSDEVDECFWFDAQLVCFSEKCVGALGEDVDFFGACEGGGAVHADVCAGALFGFRDALGFEVTVCAGDGVGVYDELFSEGADGQEFIAGLEASGGDEVFYLLDDLAVDGDAVFWRDMDVHFGLGQIVLIL